MKKIYLTLAAAGSVLACVSAGAQNLNPTVSVTKAYEGSLMEVHKPAQEMFVPDSLKRFDLDFDYSVFENPYKGSYDFSPYLLEMKPQAAALTGRKFYLKAGAGYRLRPSLDLVWEPLTKGRFRMSVYGSHHSYIGDYKNMQFDADGMLKSAGGSWNGYDLYSTAGANAQADLGKAVIAFDLNYKGIQGKTGEGATGFNSTRAFAHIYSTSLSENFLYYDIAVNYAFSSQGMLAGDRALNANDLDFKFTLGPVLSRHNRILADVGYGMTWYKGYMNTAIGTAYITPKYAFDKNRWDLSLGLKFGFNISEKDKPESVNTNNGTMIYPDVYIGFEAVRDYLNLYFRATGGDYRNQFSSMKEKYHFYLPSHGLTNNYVEQYNLALGFAGNIRNRFRYDVRGGFRSYEDMPFDGISAIRIGTAAPTVADNLMYMSNMMVVGGTAGYVNMKFQWDSRDFTLDSDFRINSNSFKDSEIANHHIYLNQSLFSGHIDGTYNWKKRIFAGVSAEFATVRKGETTLVSMQESGGELTPVAHTTMNVRVPGWLNLGLHAEYAFNNKLSFWLRGENLLNMKIQRYGMYMDGGVGFTAGICLNL